MGDLILLRHGETEWSKAGKHTGRTDIPLSPEGKAAAAALAPALARRHFVAVFSSPAQRARDTAELAGLTDITIDAGSFDATSTDIFLILILAAVFLGGPGQAYGAMLGAVVIGLATEVSAVFIPADYKYVVAFVVLLVMLGVRPTGLLGARA